MHKIASGLFMELDIVGKKSRSIMERNIYLYTLACVIVLACIIVIYNHIRTRRTLEILEKMLTDAAKGAFSEDDFNESRLSALETRFAHFFSSSMIAEQNLTAEKDKITTLISDISHQTKNPIANILLYSELLAEENLSVSAKENLTALQEQTGKLKFLIEALVKLSRLENGIVSLSIHQENIMTMLERVLYEQAPKAEKKRLQLTLLDSERSDQQAYFDPKWTQEAISNLVDNAIKYTDHGSVTLSITVYEMFIRIDIMDTGIGIQEDEIAKIFLRFYRSETVQEKEGVGIGLYLARKIISEEAGYIKVSSKYGHGSIFSVFLPREKRI